MSLQQSKSKEAQRMLDKYKGHFPVVCLSASSERRKLLVPCSMKGQELAKVARDKCSWASEDSCLSIEGVPLPLSMGVQEIYQHHSNADGFLYISVSSRSEDTAQSSEQISTKEQTLEESLQPKVFHMPDGDREKFPLSEDARKAQKILKKYPDRIPVLVRQAETPGLPKLDKKLLVPRSMTTAGLIGMLPRHLGVPDDVPVAWGKLCLHMGDVPLKKDAVMSDIYNHYVDANDGGLHITLRIHGEVPVKAEPEVDQQMQDLELQLEKALLQATASEERAAAAEVLSEDKTHQASSMQEQLAHLSQAYLAETQRCEQLQEALKASQTNSPSELVEKLETELEEQREEHAAKSGELTAKLDAKMQELSAKSTELAEKCQAEEELQQNLEKEMQRTLKAEQERDDAWAAAKDEQLKAASLAERLEKAEADLELLQMELAEAVAKAEANELTEDEKDDMQVGVDGFVHLGWDEDGFATSVQAEEEFEILVEDNV